MNDKMEAEPLPSTSHDLDLDLGPASLTGSHDSLISKTKQGPSLGPSKARSRRRLQHNQEKVGVQEKDSKEDGGHSRVPTPMEDYDTTEDEDEERTRRPSASSSQLSDSASSEGSSAPHIGRLRRRFHDLLDDAFSLLNGQRPGDKVTPLTTPSPARKGRSRSAAMQYRGVEVSEGEGGRPRSATAVHTSPPAWRDSQVVSVVPLEDGRSPKSAWGDGIGRISARPGSARPASARPSSARPGSARPNSARPGSGRSARSITPVNHPPSPDRPDGGAEEPLDPETGLRSTDPAVPLIRAIKEELRRFKSSISTESSTA
ncbi:hypothetical protein OTU49_010765 [Cherax quadricarinatus]|uniref:Uncharacterized protein n=2 Tax=Cherax quadricarinatus TaxID=27406 RepID=A0AAW0W732_CHEQU